MGRMTDIVELLENLSVSPHQQSIIDSAVDEIVRLRKDNKRLRDRMEKVSDVLYDKGELDAWAAIRNALWQDDE